MDKSPDAFRTISEVADFLETPAHVLRFWESRFPQIKPVKRAGGRRYYRPADVALLAGIRQLLHQDGMTIRGVQKILRDQGVRHVIGLSDPSLLSVSEGEADTQDEWGEDLPEIVPEIAEVTSNIVTLTDWRATPDENPEDIAAKTIASPANAIAVAEEPSDATEPPVVMTQTIDTWDIAPAPHEASEVTPANISPPSGDSASLVAEPVVTRAADPSGKDSDVTPTAPLQWSLFDLGQPIDESVPHGAVIEAQVQEQVAPVHGTESPFLASETAPDEATASELVALPQLVSDSVAEAAMTEETVALSPEAQAAVDAGATNAPEQAELPWLPPRLRALLGTHGAGARPDLAPLLHRARALQLALREAMQTRRS